jgi:saccharopine dehydrogenase-like NADP-dependent oxidoreductase
LCAVVDLHFDGKLPDRGFVKQEQVKLADFLGNRFGKCYAGVGDKDERIAIRSYHDDDGTQACPAKR